MARVELSSAFIAATLIAAGTARAQVAPARLTDWLELTYSLARDLNSGLAAIDRNGDRVTSDVDILLAVHDDVLLRETPDLDEDGVITAADVLLSIRHYIVESLPDPTVYPTYKLEDGVAILLALEEGGDVSELVDVNKDGVVSIEDYFELFEKLGQPVKTVDVPFILAQQIFNQMGWAIDIGIDVLRTAQVVLHNPEISNTWQTPANPLILPHRRHNKDLSRSNWPANHSAGVSINWNRDPNAVPSIGHQQATSASWPAEHSIEFSIERALPHIDHFAATGMSEADWITRRRALANGEAERPLTRFPSGETVGSEACAGCHAGEHAQWQTSPHRQAMSHLAGENPAAAKDPTCVRCHATAKSIPAPSELAGFRLDDGVGCESCHGPGKRHVDAGGAPGTIEGLGDDCPVCVIEAVCTSCHTKAWDPDWDLKTDLPRAGHGSPTPHP